MGAYDGAEVCELVGLYILTQLQKTIQVHSIGLYRDDGLAVLKRASGSAIDRTRKELIKAFQNCGLKITVEANLKNVNFLDVNLDLTSGIHKPYRKPNDEPAYINRLSNHPPSIIKNIPDAIAKRISTLSSNKDVFEEAAPAYNQALKNAGHTKPMAYTETSPDQRKTKKTRTRKTIWYNPPYSKNVNTNIGSKFLKILDRHFPRGNKLNKIFNRNTVKISYSCVTNINQVIKAHNLSAMKKADAKKTSNKRTCNCHKKAECPLRGKCQVENVVYKATVSSERGEESYIGLASGMFKKRYYNHTKAFENIEYITDTELSKYVWGLKKKEIKFTITWEVVRHSNIGIRTSGQCNLCLDEKCEILLSNSLNKKSELISKCRHNKTKKPANRVKKK